MVNEFADFGDIFTNFYLSRRLPSHFVEDKEVQNRVIEYRSSCDEHIKDFKIEKIPYDEENKRDAYKINVLHKMIDSNDMAEIPLSM